MSASGEVELTPAQLCKRWGDSIVVRTLANWRSRGEGPAFNKRGSRITYALSDVLEYERENRFRGVKDYGKKEKTA